jgi:transposase
MNHVQLAKQYKRDFLFRLFESGESDNTKIAHLVDLSESWVRTLRRVYESEGAAGFILQKPGGSVAQLDAPKLAKLREILEKGAVIYGLEGAYWDSKRVRFIIENEFKIIYSLPHVLRILAKLNYTLQVPQKKDYRQSEEKMAEWVNKTLPEIKKK